MSYVLRGVGAGFEKEGGGGAQSAVRGEGQSISAGLQALATKMFGNQPGPSGGGGGMLKSPIVLGGGALALFLYLRSRKKRGR